MMNRTIAVIFATLLALAACGQKGPLYLPDAPGVQTTTAGDTKPKSEAEAERLPGQPTDTGAVKGQPGG